MSESIGYILDGGLRHQGEDVHHAVRDLAAAHGFFDEFRQSFFRADARPQALRRSRPLSLHALQRSKRLLHGRVAAFGGRFLAQAHERGAHERLQFRFSLDGQLIAQPADRLHQRAAVPAAVQFAQVRKPDRRRSPRFRRFQAHARSVFHQNFVDGLQFPAPQHVFQERAHVARRHAPGLVRNQHFFLVLFGYLLPEFLVQ